MSDAFETVTVEGSERLITPIDHMGLPYCFAPTHRLPPPGSPPEVLEGDINLGRTADFNHQFPTHEVTNSASPALNDLGKAALISSRVQWVDYRHHHGPYNHRFIGPAHPQTVPDLFKTLAMAAAGYVPEFAIDLSGDDPRIIGLTQKQRKWLWTSEQVRVHCHADVSKFLLDYVLNVDLDHINQVDIEEFIYTFDYERRLKLGRALIDQVVERASDPLEPTYQEVRQNNLLTFVTVGNLKRPSPTSARELVKVKLVKSRNAGYIRSVFERRLAGQPRRSRAEYEAWAA